MIALEKQTKFEFYKAKKSHNDVKNEIKYELAYCSLLDLINLKLNKNIFWREDDLIFL